MMLKWFNAREATEAGTGLADQFASRVASDITERGKGVAKTDPNKALQELLERADSEVRSLNLNLYKKAKFANSFKWRLLENGVEKALAEEVTQRLVLHLSANKPSSALLEDSDAKPPDRPHSNNAKSLFGQANKCIEQGAYVEAINLYEDLIRIDPRHAAALNNLGAALCKLGRYKEAEGYFRRAIKVEPDFSDPYSNIGNAFLVTGQYAEAEGFLRRALKLNPRFVEARVNLGLTLAFLSRLRDAKAHFEKVLKLEPRNSDALFGMALVAKTEGSFDLADGLLIRALQVNPNMPNALAAQVGMRKMTSLDGAWLEHAEEVAASGIAPVNESELRFAIGKYCDDVGDFKRAFQNYERANDLLKPIAEPYDRDARKRYVDMMIQVHTPEFIARRDGSASTSMKPVFVVGMPRSGTSLTEQIIASHPSAKAAGELPFWSLAVYEHEAAIRDGSLSESTRTKLAEAYLRVLEAKSGDALRIVDKAPVNSDYLGVIHSVFPNARFIYMRRDPIDNCLSCYFQKFVLSLNYTIDLSDLADYYREHERMMAHWRAVLPQGTILDVPYEGLVADQQGWTRKILDFLGLEWNEQVLEFHKTKRAIVTASFWQARQKIYTNSVQRWRNYEKFIGPLLVGLRGLDH
jgi:tetratricopeptide (TPR) repeat protein